MGTKAGFRDCIAQYKKGEWKKDITKREAYNLINMS